MLLFASAFGMAYTIQFLFLILLVEGGNVNEYLAQFLGLFIYGGANFLLNKKVTFQ
ncbi:membrane protein containing GtrA-like protein domain protein [gut metagenome]|uniref:Membrane protein containing GtrA-like protein domain protein n=1 Tax=gut metagenome TaxID=749906 RepID=J9GU80_9ZZZZ